MSGFGGGLEGKHVTSRQLSWFVKCSLKFREVLYTNCHTQGIRR
jgi:hypothetical protein